MRGVHEDWQQLGALAHLSAMRLHPLLRQFTKPARHQTCARNGASRDRVCSTRGALALLLCG